MNTTETVSNKMNGKQSFKDMKDGVKDAAKDLTYNLSDKFGEATEAVSSKLMDEAADIKERASAYTSKASAYVRANPMSVALGAAAVGLIAGWFIARKK